MFVCFSIVLTWDGICVLVFDKYVSESVSMYSYWYSYDPSVFCPALDSRPKKPTHAREKPIRSFLHFFFFTYPLRSLVSFRLKEPLLFTHILLHLWSSILGLKRPTKSRSFSFSYSTLWVSHTYHQRCLRAPRPRPLPFLIPRVCVVIRPWEGVS